MLLRVNNSNDSNEDLKSVGPSGQHQQQTATPIPQHKTQKDECDYLKMIYGQKDSNDAILPDNTSQLTFSVTPSSLLEYNRSRSTINFQDG